MKRRGLSLGHALALLAALALMFVMALDWYTTKQGEEFRRIQQDAQDVQTEDPRIQEAEERAGEAAEGQERNAWQADGAIDRLILLVLLGTVLATAAASLLRAGGRRFEPPFTPIAGAAALAVLAELLVAYRIVQEPGLDEATEVTFAPPLALLCLALIVIGGFRAMKVEEEEPAAEEPAPAEPSEPPEASLHSEA